MNLVQQFSKTWKYEKFMTDNYDHNENNDDKIQWQTNLAFGSGELTKQKCP